LAFDRRPAQLKPATPRAVRDFSPPEIVRLGNIPAELTRIGIYCARCFGFRGYGPDTGPGGGRARVDRDVRLVRGARG
jgi:hypothetical protein